MIVLDTNVVAELMGPAPNATVIAWLRAHPARQLVTTAITVAEVRYGIARLPAGPRRRALAASADEAFDTFAEQILPFDLDAANRFDGVVIRRERAGAPISALDAQIAAICLSTSAQLATRNVADFEGVGLTVLDPWAAPLGDLP
jgi:toxin FitB